MRSDSFVVTGVLLVVISLTLPASAEKEQATNPGATLAGLVLPADAQPGDRISGSVVEDRTPYEGIPGLKVIGIPPQMLTAPSGSISGVVIDTGTKEPKSAEYPVVFTVPEGDSNIRMAFRRNDHTNLCKRISIPIVSKSRPMQDNFDCLPVVPAGGIQTIHGPFDGNSEQTHVDIGGRPLEVIAESPRVAYVNIPADFPAGSYEMTVVDEPNFATLPVSVLNLAMSADQLTLHAGQSTKFHVVVSGPEQMPESAWQAGIPSELVDPGTLTRLLPNFNPPRPGEKGVVALRLENTVPEVVSMKDSKNEVISLILDRKSFAEGPFRYDGTIKSKRAGGFNINGIVIAFFAPVIGEEGSLPSERTESEDFDDQTSRGVIADRLHQLSKDTKGACSQITDAKKKEDLEQFADMLEEKANEVAEDSGPVSEEIEDLLFNCQTNDDAAQTKKRMEVYRKYLDTLDPKLREERDKLHEQRLEAKKKAEEAERKAAQAHQRKYDPEKKKKHDQAYEKWLKARENVKDLEKKLEDAKQKAESAAKDPKNAKSNEFGNYEQAKKDLAAANSEYEKTKESWKDAYDENQKAIDPELQKQEDQAYQEAKAANEEFKQKTNDYLKKAEEYNKSGDQKLYDEYQKLRDEYLNPPDVKT